MNSKSMDAIRLEINQGLYDCSPVPCRRDPDYREKVQDYLATKQTALEALRKRLDQEVPSLTKAEQDECWRNGMILFASGRECHCCLVSLTAGYLIEAFHRFAKQLTTTGETNK